MDKDVYCQKELFVAQVDKDDNIIGPVERWLTHKNGILHRGFTLVMIYQNNFVLQQRKHLAFDKTLDLTSSSHQVFKNGDLQSDDEAIYEMLSREWNLSKNDLKEGLTKKGSVYYKAKDPNSAFTEHEIDYVYSAKLKRLPEPNPDYAYGYELTNAPKKFLAKNTPAPWVEKIINLIL